MTKSLTAEKFNRNACQVTTGEELPLAVTKEKSREQQTAQSKLNKIIKTKIAVLA